MTATIILTLIMCALLFLMIWAAAYFYPWDRLLEFFPKDIEEKAKQHKPPYPAAPAMDIVQCPYNNLFAELGTPELTKIFCINDECTYGDIPGLDFIRHTTLGTGGDKCDFYVRVQK